MRGGAMTITELDIRDEFLKGRREFWESIFAAAFERDRQGSGFGDDGAMDVEPALARAVDEANAALEAWEKRWVVQSNADDRRVS
jgi:hypothetical protein